jgi:CDP-diacylglycerol--glycerol-3-phosphate 3-phosphatidyltransferase
MRSFRSYIPNALSVGRVPAAIAFLFLYSNTDIARFRIAVAIGFVALASDFLDGYLARRWQVATQTGYFLDGLGDKTFHFAVLLVILREHASPTLLIWLLTVREVVLYALRTLDTDLEGNLKRLRQLSRYHAFFIRIYFGAFFVFDGLGFVGRHEPNIMLYGEIFGWIAVVLGYLAIAKLTKNIAQES